MNGKRCEIQMTERMKDSEQEKAMIGSACMRACVCVHVCVIGMSVYLCLCAQLYACLNVSGPDFSCGRIVKLCFPA